MQKKILNIFLFAIVSILLNSCFQDVIDIDLGENSNQVVIEAVLTNESGSQDVRVSTVGDYYKNGKEKKVSGAIVTIRSEANGSVRYEEVELEPGLYRAENFKGEPGVTYNLNVTVNGKVYTASSKMPKIVEMDSLRLKRSSSYNYFLYKLHCYFTDKKDVENYLWFKFYKNDELASNTTYLYNDRNSDGEKIEYDDFDELDIRQLDRLRLEVFALDKNAYNYLYSLFGYQSDLDIDLPELFPSNSYNPNTNISNGGLGYFSACAIKEYNVK